MEYLFEGLAIGVLLFLSAFFSSSETAIFHLPRLTTERIASRFPIIKEREKMLATILLANTIVNAGASIFAAKIFYNLYASNQFAIITGIMTYIILVLGEFSPKLYSLANSEKVAIKVVPGITLIHYILLPITIPINAITRLITPPSWLPKKLITREKIKLLIQCEAEDGTITEREKIFMTRVLEFKDKKVAHIMTNIDKIEALPISAELDEIDIAKLTHSRIPVYKGEIHNIVGILYIKDLLNQNYPCKIRKITRKPYFTSPYSPASDLLLQFKRIGAHIAIVTDLNKKNIGIVTLDDLINAIIK